MCLIEPYILSRWLPSERLPCFCLSHVFSHVLRLWGKGRGWLVGHVVQVRYPRNRFSWWNSCYNFGWYNLSCFCFCWFTPLPKTKRYGYMWMPICSFGINQLSKTRNWANSFFLKWGGVPNEVRRKEEGWLYGVKGRKGLKLKWHVGGEMGENKSL